MADAETVAKGAGGTGGSGGEELLWEGAPSHVLNWKVYAVCVVLSPLVVPLLVLAWKWVELKNQRYALTTERLQTRTGVFSKRTDDLELYRVRDVVIEEPFFYRLFGAGNIRMQTSDRTHPEFLIPAVKDPHGVTEHIRRQVERMRQQKRVREVDFE